MTEEVKQEGEFKLKKKKAPKKLNKTDEPTKIDLSKVKKAEEQEEIEVIKVEIPTETKEKEDVIDEKITETEEKVEEITEITEITSKDVIEQSEVTDILPMQSDLPENIESLVNFMQETGGSIEDYVRLNADYSNVESDILLKEYYKNTKSYLDADDIDLLIEEFEYDEDLDDEKDIRKKKLAYKEEVAKAKEYLESVKEKYYKDIKAKQAVQPQQQNETNTILKQRRESFIESTNNFFSRDFKGFDFNMGDKKFRYNVKDASRIAENQSDMDNFVKKFLNKDNQIADYGAFHKALYVANNPDKVINHFYEQGKADAIKEVMANSKNVSNDIRTTSPTEFTNGIKVVTHTGKDSSKLKIKKVKI